jgi:hypothetical protein
LITIIILGFFLFILFYIFKNWIWQKIAIYITPKTALKIGLLLILTGSLLLSGSYFSIYPKYVTHVDGQHVSIDIIGIIGFFLIFIGLVIIIMKWYHPTIEKHAQDHGRAIIYDDISHLF